MTEHIRPRSKTSIPGWVEFSRDPTGFCDRGLKRQKLREAYQALRAERREIKKRPAALADLNKNLRAGYDQYLGEVIQNARKFIDHNRNNSNPFQHFQNRAERYRLHNFIPFSIFEQALELLSADDDPTAITEVQRTKELTKLEKKMEAVKEELAAVSPPGDFEFQQADVNADIFVQFFDSWHNLQTCCVSEVGLTGRSLRHSPEPEMRAYYKLGLGKIQNPKAVKLPAP